MAERGYVDPAMAGLPQWQALLEAPLASAASVHHRMVFTSAAFLELVHWSAEQLVGRPWLPVLLPDLQEREALLREVSPLYEAGSVLRHSVTVTCGDGRRRPMEWTTTGVTMPDGARGLMTIAVDKSGQEVAGGASLGERGFAELVEDAPDLLLRVDALGGRMLYVNRAVERLTGHGP